MSAEAIVTNIESPFHHPAEILSKEEFNSLVLKAQQGDENAKNRVIFLSEKTVNKVVFKFIGQLSKADFDDLVQEGRIGLLEAIKRFNPDLGYAFSTYAKYWVRAKIDEYIKETKFTIRLPSNKQKNAFRYYRFLITFETQYGRTPSTEEIAQTFDITEDEVTKLLEEYNYWHRGHASSLDAPLRTNEDADSLYDITPDNNPNNKTDNTALNAEIKHNLDNIITNITALIIKTKTFFAPSKPLALTVLYKRIITPDEKTLDEIGQEFEVTRERVRQVEAKIFEIIKKNPEIMEELTLLKQLINDLL
jgi:RNA polymerase sigma factor (sigma-70 family)